MNPASLTRTMYYVLLYTLLTISVFVTVICVQCCHWPTICCCSLPGGGATECYSCEYAIRHYDCLQLPTLTCAAGEVCYTEVQRRGLEGKRYYKGCMERRRCYNRMSLNEDDFCDTVANYCTYCCEGDLCNAYNTATRRRVMTTSVYISAFIFFVRMM